MIEKMIIKRKPAHKPIIRSVFRIGASLLVLALLPSAVTEEEATG